MQFGRIHALLLAVLGFVLFGVQAALFFSNNVAVGTDISARAATHKTNPAPGILGSLSLIAAATIFATRRRTDEPKPENAIR